jgi:energy-converting hydrogenase Eha subunit A
LARLLDRGPLRLVGRVSYGIYLWHWPIIVLVTEDTTPARGITLLLLRLALIAGATAISWLLIERPYRRAPRRRAIPIAVSGIAVAAICLLTLPSEQRLAYANVDVTTIPTPVIATPAFSGVGVKTVMVIGDSGMYDATPALVAGFTSVGAQVISTAFAGEGLTTPAGGRDSWAKTVDQYRPDLVVVMLGAWDYDWVAREGDNAYQEQIDATVRMLNAHGARIVWLSVLPGDAVLPGKRVQATTLDRFYAALPARFPGVVEYVDIATPLTNASGTVRKPDAWHLCADGAAVVAHTVLTELGIDAPAWDDGPWRADERYDNPHGGCPG